MAFTTTRSLSTRNKILTTLLLAALLACNWLPKIDLVAQTYLTDTISSNAIVFGVVRTLNGVISVVQSAEVGVGVAGITLGEIFDPVNDLIERFSGLLLVTLTALGIQQVLLLFTTSLTLKIAFSLATLIATVLLWLPKTQHLPWLRLIIVVVIIRFLLSIEVGFVWLFDWLYFDATGQEALSVLDAAARVIDSIKERITDIDLSSLIFGSNTPVLASEDISSRIATSVVTLIVGMLFKSILIPLATLWFGYKVCNNLMFGHH